MKTLALMLICASACWAQDAPRFDKAYWSAAAVAGVGTALDAYTTVSRIGPTHYCTVEGYTPELYGRQPGAARVSIVMGAQFAGAMLAAYELKKHGKGRLWLVPLAADSVHWQGAIHNFQHCP